MDLRKIIVGSIVFTALYNIFLYQVQPGLGIGFFFLVLNLYFFFIKNKDSKNNILAVSSSILSILFGFLFAYRENLFVQLVDLAAAVFLSLITLYFHKQPQKFLPEIFSFLILPLKLAKDSLLSFFNFTDKNNWSFTPKHKEIASSSIRGTLIAIPVFLVLLFLLTKADPIFANLTETFFKNIGERTIISIIIFSILLVFGITKVAEHIAKKAEFKQVSFGKIYELLALTGGIITLFAIFIFIQFSYLFSSLSEKDLYQLGIKSLTYSEYVRKGFFELLIVAVIAITILVYILRFLHGLKDRQKTIMQVISGILTIETGLLLLSAAQRVNLYADGHGLTRARIFGFIFLIWLAALLIFFLIRVIKEMRKEHFFLATLTTTILTLLTINLVNIDGLIATKYKPTVNNEVDYFYISRLSTDASEGWKPAIIDAEEIIKNIESNKIFSIDDQRKIFWTRSTLNQIQKNREYLLNKYEKRDNKWQSWNYSEYFAYKIITKERIYFEKIASLLDRINSLDQQTSSKTYQEVPVDRSTKPPLIH